MKKTQFTDVIMDIRKNIVSMVSVFVFVSLSVAIFFGLGWYIRSMNQSYDAYLDEGMVSNIEYYFAYGADDDDLKKFEETDGVDIAEGTYIAYGYAETDDGAVISEFKTSDGQLNRIELVEGTYPQSADEVLVEKYAASKYGIRIGDVIDVEGEDTTAYYLANRIRNGNDIEDADKLEEESAREHHALKYDKMKVSGIVLSSAQTVYPDRPYYYATLAKTEITFFVEKEALDIDNLPGYSRVCIYSDKLAALDFVSDEYSSEVEELAEKLEPVADEINNSGYERIKNAYQNLLDDLGEKLSDAREELDDGKAELEDAKEKYAGGVLVIDNAETELRKGRQELAEGKIQLADARTQLDEALSELLSYQDRYDAAKTQFDDVKARYESVKSVIRNDIYMSTDQNDVKAERTELIEDVATKVLDYKKTQESGLTEEDVVNWLKENADEEIKTFVSLSTLAETGCEDNNLIKFADNVINYSSGYDNYIRGVLALTYNENLLYLAKNNKDLVSADEISVYNLTIDDLIDLHDQYIDIIDAGYISVEYDRYNGKASDLDYTWYFINETKAVGEKISAYDEQIAEGQRQLDDAAAKLSSGWSEYEDYKSLYEEKEAEYYSGLNEYNAGVINLAEAKRTLSNSKIRISDAEKELVDGEKEYADGLDSYEKLKENGNAIESSGYVTRYKANNMSASVLETISTVCNKSKNSLVSMYFVIALLICYCVISRMISDSIRLIGTKKALGFRKSEILIHYLLAIIIVLLASFVAGVAASFLVQYIIIYAMEGTIQFTMDRICFSVWEVLLLFIGYLAAFGIITFISCSAILKRTAVSLLTDGSDVYNKKHFYQRFRAWNSLSILSKTTINNCFNDRRRVLSTIIGISSCVVLLVSAVTLGNDVRNSFIIQYRDYYHFDTLVKYDADEADEEEIQNFLSEKGIVSANLFSENLNVTLDGETYSGYGFIYPTGEDISEFMDIESATDKPFDNSGIWVSAGVNQIKGFQIGDEIAAESYLGEKICGEISGFVEEHVANITLYIGSDTYEELSGKKYETNTLLFDKGDYSTKEVENMLSDIEGITTVWNFAEYEAEINDLLVMLTGIIELIYFSASLILAVFVILNLLTTLVEEKRMEVIVLMINGYSYKQAKKYIYTDTIYLTAVSVLAGLVIGNIMGVQMVKQMEEIYIVFIHTFDLSANIIATVITVLLVYIMSCIALKRVDKFRLNEVTQ